MQNVSDQLQKSFDLPLLGMKTLMAAGEIQTRKNIRNKAWLQGGQTTCYCRLAY
jgi:hypothetical protein